LGAEVTEVELQWTAAMEQAYNGHMDQLFFAALVSLMESKRELMCDYNVFMAEQGLKRQQDPLNYYRAVCTESEMYAEFGALMENYDAFVCPTVMTNTLRADFNPVCDNYVVNGIVQEHDLAISSCHYFNMMGRCPAISVPSGIGDNGVPTGLQIVSRAFDDVAVFRVAAALEGSWDGPFQPSM
jgi:Asp-tRNA(Asn)/Glu-tRNA(Gln) amidotransferase A subunit family amidase